MTLSKDGNLRQLTHSQPPSQRCPYTRAARRRRQPEHAHTHKYPSNFHQLLASLSTPENEQCAIQIFSWRERERNWQERGWKWNWKKKGSAWETLKCKFVCPWPWRPPLIPCSHPSSNRPFFYSDLYDGGNCVVPPPFLLEHFNNVMHQIFPLLWSWRLKVVTANGFNPSTFNCFLCSDSGRDSFSPKNSQKIWLSDSIFLLFFSPFIRPKFGKMHEATCMVRKKSCSYENLLGVLIFLLVVSFVLLLHLNLNFWLKKCFFTI